MVKPEENLSPILGRKPINKEHINEFGGRYSYLGSVPGTVWGRVAGQTGRPGLI